MLNPLFPSSSSSADLKHMARNKTAVAVAKELGGCKPFGCATTQY
jgi:hypothetical protein